jgi:hypothetical protein
VCKLRDTDTHKTQGPMIFKCFELRVATGVMVVMNGTCDTGTDICRDENCNQFRYGVWFDEFQPMTYLTLNVDQVVVPITRTEKMYTVPDGLVFVCDSPPSNTEQDHVCTKNDSVHLVTRRS